MIGNQFKLSLNRMKWLEINVTVNEEKPIAEVNWIKSS